MGQNCRILITGVNGFVGRSLCENMLDRSWRVCGSVRSAKDAAALPTGVEAVEIQSIGPDTNWSNALIGMDTVVHLAARVHVMRETDADPLAAFRHVNVAGTERLALMAAEAGVRRFVFLSSVGVNGNVTHDRPFKEEDEPHPQNHYALSKLEAEQALKEIASETGMELVIIRSPLVYGRGNPGNFLRLLNLVDKGLPLPLASVSNSRSLIYLGNLVDAIVTCINHPKAAGQTYLVSDGEDASTPELIREVAYALDKPARLLPFPASLMRLAGRLTGKSEAVDRLLGSLVVDSSKIRRELGWKPPYTMEEGLRETGEWFKRRF
jgi:nucleoside-diphosphate-sugar epimerase